MKHGVKNNHPRQTLTIILEKLQFSEYWPTIYFKGTNGYLEVFSYTISDTGVFP